jgi:hypothetical protein
MFASYKINPSLFASGTTESSINIPINLHYQIVDNSELIENTFVKDEIQKAVNPILDYEKTRFVPVIRGTTSRLDTIKYNVNILSGSTILSPTKYSDIGFDNDDIKFERNNFKDSYLYLAFYDDTNPLTQNLVTSIEVYTMLTDDDRYGIGAPAPIIPGQPKPANQISVRFILSNPLTTKGFYEGYHIYDYKSDVLIDQPKYLYMKATYFNAKTGKIVNLMADSKPYSIDKLIDKTYTKYKLFRDSTGFYYEIEDASNVSYSNINTNPILDATINLYQIQAL